MATRSVTRHSVFGDAGELPHNVLPTNRQVAQHFLHMKKRKNDSNKDKYRAVSDAVISLWNKATIPTMHYRSVIKRVETMISTGSELSRSKSSSARQSTFLATLDSLFDIAACKCSMSYDNSTKQVSISCNCPRNLKVPPDELLFLYDQRNSRKMFMANLDFQATNRLQKRLQRKIEEETRCKMPRKFSSAESNLNLSEEESSNSCASDQSVAEDSDDEVLHDSDDKSSSIDDVASDDISSRSDDDVAEGQMRIPLPNLAKEADRYGISDRAAASLATAVLIDVGFITKQNQSFVIDKNKVHRERLNLRKGLQRDMRQSPKGITSIYFDGRRDTTLVKVNRSGKWYGDTTVENHYVLVEEPGSSYLTHVTPSSGRSTDIANSIVTVIREQDASDSILAIGCDSTNANVGSRGGVIRHLEVALGRPLNWFICLLHTNELPLRHLFTTLDGPTSGATSFSGPIGRELHHCELKHIANFTKITSQHSMPVLDEDVVADLSCDQKYLYDIVTAIRTGVVSENLSARKPGPLNHSRWLTFANRVCRLYVATDNPSANLCIITHFIVTNYAANWFNIKHNPSCTYGARHVYHATQLLKELSSETAAIVKPYISRSAYFAHSENILIAMLADSDKSIRSRAVDIILQQRLQASTAAIRLFKVPPINYDATNYVDLINWEDIQEPPLTMKLTDDDIAKFSNEPLTLNYKNHTQGVERCIKLVTDASKAVYGF
ncbi:hypothetical protein Bpfe_021670 [Biomphalaria pfeifferi]|uniref:Uncharacterized protein n=1 Tax=Biomphalaria pfeifferi TaxID=112525 RepID=A0AAD8F3P1_BIOPF|nr:hypothetical protein Bpfe_021670 [Biomphalaria pfeifferi]